LIYSDSLINGFEVSGCEVPMMDQTNRILERIQKIKTAQVDGKRAPHKPLLILLALAHYQKGQRIVRFADIEQPLASLLRCWAPPIKSAPNPTKPWWHLKSDGFWEIHDLEQLGSEQTIKAYRQSSASFSSDVLHWLDTDDSALTSIAWLILQEHFFESTWDDILVQCELDIPAPFALSSSPSYIAAGTQDSASAVKRYRDSSFRRDVLKAYDYRCAVTDFQLSIGGVPIGCEAAHVKAHSFAGPDSVDNGLALEPTLHQLYDRGIWTLTDDCRILVSQEFSGSGSALERIRALHGKPIRSPMPGQPQPNIEYIRWHRDPKLGGVFRGPALPL